MRPVAFLIVTPIWSIFIFSLTLNNQRKERVTRTAYYTQKDIKITRINFSCCVSFNMK